MEIRSVPIWVGKRFRARISREAAVNFYRRCREGGLRSGGQVVSRTMSSGSTV